MMEVQFNQNVNMISSPGWRRSVLIHEQTLCTRKNQDSRRKLLLAVNETTSHKYYKSKKTIKTALLVWLKQTEQNTLDFNVL